MTRRAPAAPGDESSVHTWIDSDFVPSWLRPFSLGSSARFTRTPDHLLRKSDDVAEELESPGYCIGGAGWHFLDVPETDAGEDLSSFPSLMADLEALETAFSDMKGAADLSDDESATFRAESGFIASFVSEELGPSLHADASEPAVSDAPWAAVEMGALIEMLEGATQEPQPVLDSAPALVVDTIGQQMAESWLVRVVDSAGPPAYLLALQQSILLGDADFARSAAMEALSQTAWLQEEAVSGDAVMLSDWDESAELQPRSAAEMVELEDGDALMLSDFDEEAQASVTASAPVWAGEQPATEAGESVTEECVAEEYVALADLNVDAPAIEADAAEMQMPVETVADAAGALLTAAPATDEIRALAEDDLVGEDLASDMAWEGAFLSYLNPDEDADDLAELVQAESAVPMETAALVVTETAEVPVEVVAAPEGPEFEEMQHLEDEAQHLMDAELEGETDFDAGDADEEDTSEQFAVAEIEVATEAVEEFSPEPAGLLSAAAAVVAPVAGASFFWQPYQQSIASDLMHFGAAFSAPAVAAAPLMAAASIPELPVASAVADADVLQEDCEAENSFGGYELPSLELLSEAPQLEPDYELSEEALDQNSTALQQILRDFGVRGEIIDANPGPVVTLYEFEPAPGVKSSRVIGLADDIARSMSAISARVAVVPGRNVIGIELPNKRRDTVWLRELLASQEFGEARTKLGIGLGKTIGGEPVIADLARMPHLLVAGTTGSGKSVAINTMILSLLYQHTPEQCRLIMIDPKMLELSIYEGIPHLLTPVVTDPKKAIIALKWAVKEMEDRYRKMARLAVRNIDGFNARMAEARAKGEIITRQVQVGFDKESGEALFEEQEMDLSPLPYIVIIVDEMADLMMVAGKEIEGAIQRLAQMARAAGIHLVMATQRPSVDVITGTIKANFPTRISFQVTSKIDSRTILGEMGAETLLGQGDMLFMAGGGRIQRVHGPFVSDAEVEHVVNFLKTQGGPEYLDDVVTDEEAEGPADNEDGAVFDKGALGEGSGDLYDQAVAIVLRDRKASTSYIQRRLQVGYNKAASLMERMENEGIVGPANHAGKREILAFSRGD